MQGFAHCRIFPADAPPTRKRPLFALGSVVHEIFNKNYPPAKRVKIEAKEDPEDEKEEFEDTKEELEQALDWMEEKVEEITKEELEQALVWLRKKLGEYSRSKWERMVELEVVKKLVKTFDKDLETLNTLEELQEMLGKKLEKAFGNKFQKQMQEKKRPHGSIALAAVVSDRVPSADTRSFEPDDPSAVEHVLEACHKLLAEQDGQ